VRDTTAGWWRRFLGYLIDGTIVGVIGAAVGNARWLAFLLGVAYWVFFIGYDGHATLGMRLLGMRVVPEDGRDRVTYVDALVRWIMMVVGGACLGLGFLWAAWDNKRQAWHDKVARTLVVRV
jgi:uncharacterized RDD family membrane protein YckC